MGERIVLGLTLLRRGRNAQARADTDAVSDVGVGRL